MRTLAAATVIVALVSGISFANAASNRHASGNGRYCVEQTAGSFQMYCNFASLRACQKQAQPQFLRCMPNPNYGTTGSASRR